MSVPDQFLDVVLLLGNASHAAEVIHCDGENLQVVDVRLGRPAEDVVLNATNLLRHHHRLNLVLSHHQRQVEQLLHAEARFIVRVIQGPEVSTTCSR